MLLNDSQGSFTYIITDMIIHCTAFDEPVGGTGWSTLVTHRKAVSKQREQSWCEASIFWSLTQMHIFQCYWSNATSCRDALTKSCTYSKEISWLKRSSKWVTVKRKVANFTLTETIHKSLFTAGEYKTQLEKYFLTFYCHIFIQYLVKYFCIIKHYARGSNTFKMISSVSEVIGNICAN